MDKFCIDCRHCKAKNSPWPHDNSVELFCTHPSVEQRRDLVTGSPLGELKTCFKQRYAVEQESVCGTEATHFEPKEPI